MAGVTVIAVKVVTMKVAAEMTMAMIAVGGGGRWKQQDSGERRSKRKTTQHRILLIEQSIADRYRR
jgi:hypothetical protein